MSEEKTESHALAELHAIVAARLTELVRACDNPKVFDCAIRFLKDNGVNEDLAKKLLGGERVTPQDFIGALPQFEDEEESKNGGRSTSSG